MTSPSPTPPISSLSGELPSEWAALSMRFTVDGHRLLTLITDRHGVVTNHCRVLEGIPAHVREDARAWEEGATMAREVLGDIPTELYLCGRGGSKHAHHSWPTYAPLKLNKMPSWMYAQVIAPLWGSLITGHLFDPEGSAQLISGSTYQLSRHNAEITNPKSFCVTDELRRDSDRASRAVIPSFNAIDERDRLDVPDVVTTLAHRPVVPVTSSRTIHVHTDGSRDATSPDRPGYGLGISIQDQDAGQVEFYSCYEQPDTPYQSQQFELSGALRTLEELSHTYDISPGAKLTIRIYCDNTWAASQINKLVGRKTARKRWEFLQDAFPDESYHAVSSWLSDPRIHVQGVWIKGHAGRAFNTACDKLANVARLCADGMRTKDDYYCLLEELHQKLGSVYDAPQAQKPGKKPSGDNAKEMEASALQPEGIGPFVNPNQIEISVASCTSDGTPGYALGALLHGVESGTQTIASFEPCKNDQERHWIHTAAAMRILDSTVTAHRMNSSSPMSITLYCTDAMAVNHLAKMFETNDMDRRLQLFRKILDAEAESLPAWMTDTSVVVQALHGKRMDRNGALSRARSIARGTLEKQRSALQSSMQWTTLKEINDAAQRHVAASKTSASHPA